MARQKNKRQVKPSVYMFVEGETEVRYFEALKQRLRLMNVSIKVMTLTNSGNDWIDKAANQLRNNTAIRRQKSDPVIIIFDKNADDEARLTGMLEKAKQKNFQVGFSNSAFEVWLVAHYEKLTAKLLSDKDLKNKLYEYLGNTYEKANAKQIDQLVDNYQTAIENASAVNQVDFAKQSTTVPQVVTGLINIG